MCVIVRRAMEIESTRSSTAARAFARVLDYLSGTVVGGYRGDRSNSGAGCASEPGPGDEMTKKFSSSLKSQCCTRDNKSMTGVRAAFGACARLPLLIEGCRGLFRTHQWASLVASLARV